MITWAPHIFFYPWSNQLTLGNFQPKTATRVHALEAVTASISVNNSNRTRLAESTSVLSVDNEIFPVFITGDFMSWFNQNWACCRCQDSDQIQSIEFAAMRGPSMELPPSISNHSVWSQYSTSPQSNLPQSPPTPVHDTEYHSIVPAFGNLGTENLGL